MASKFPFRLVFVALCLLLASAPANAFSASSIRRSNAPTRAAEQPEESQSPPVFVLPTTASLSKTRLFASNTFDSGTKKITVKQRPRVMVDRETGKITEIKPAPSLESGSRMNPWNLLKQTFYSTADAVKSVQGSINKEKAPARPVDGYSSTIEKTVLKSTSASPGERLMKEYQVRALDTTTTTKQSTSFFDNVKSSVYGTVDGITSLAKPQEETKPLKSPLQSFKPVVQPTLASSSQVKDALPDLKSKSPAKRVLAELKIRNWEDEQRRRKRDFQRQEAAETFKEAMFSFGDFLISFISSLGELPTKLNEAVEATKQWMSSVPVAVKNTVDKVTSIPEKVDQTVDKVQTTVETSIETTKKAVKDVQELPSKIQKTVESTKHGVEETITNVKVLVGVEKKRPVPPQMPPPKPRTAEELAWDVAGGVATVTGKAAWFVTVGAAKLSFAGAKLAVSKLSENMVEQRTQDAGMETVVASTTVVETPKTVAVKEDVQVTETTPAPKPTSLSKPKSSSGSGFGGMPKTTKPAPAATYETSLPKDETESEKAEKAALDKEVSDALALAEKAMAMADEPIGKKKRRGRKSELDEALQKAREAAVTATSQAVEMEKSTK